jgi:signal transduction histidine kinase
VRRQITLLVAATTSIVLLAFLLPAASLVARVAEGRALDAAQAQVQFLTPSVGLDRPDQVAANLIGTTGGLRTAVRWTDGIWLGEPVDRDPPAPSGATQTVSDDGALLLQPVQRADGEALISVFVPAETLRAGVTRTWVVLGGLGTVLLALALLVADRLARTMTRPVTELAHTAHQLGSGDLTARAVPAGPAEVRDVATAVNRLAERIDELLDAEREGAADLAHRLRTPLTALRLDVEALPPADRERLLAGVDAVNRGVDEVIFEARRSVREGLAAGCDAAAVVGERVRFWAVLCEEEARPLTVDLPAAPTPVRVPAADLAAAVDALLGNVVAHTPDGTAVSVTVRSAADGEVHFVVADAGPGLRAGAVERGRSDGGSTGLGLDIVRRTAEGSGGELRIASTGAGTAVTMVLGRPAA